MFFQNANNFRCTVFECCGLPYIRFYCCQLLILRITICLLSQNPDYEIHEAHSIFYFSRPCHLLSANMCPDARPCAPVPCLSVQRHCYMTFAGWGDESSSKRIILYLLVYAVYSVSLFSWQNLCFHFIPGAEVYSTDVNWRSVSLGAVWQFSSPLLWNSRKLFQNKLFLCIDFTYEPTEQYW